MKKLSLLFAVAIAAPAFAQTTPTNDAGTSTTSYPPCSAQVTDQCKETAWTHGHGHMQGPGHMRGHGHGHGHGHHKGHHHKK